MTSTHLEDHPAVALNPEAIRRSLRATFLEAIPSGIMLGLTDSFMIPYAPALGAIAFQVGLLSSVCNLVLSLI